jgi:uncharacterized protein (UPF0335 family)
MPVAKIIMRGYDSAFQYSQKSGLKIMAPASMNTGNMSANQLKAFISRIEKLEEEKAGLAADIRDIYAEAKGTGFDPKIMRQLIRLRKMDDQARIEQQELLELYQSVLASGEVAKAA